MITVLLWIGVVAIGVVTAFVAYVVAATLILMSFTKD